VLGIPLNKGAACDELLIEALPAISAITDAAVRTSFGIAISSKFTRYIDRLSKHPLGAKNIDLDQPESAGSRGFEQSTGISMKRTQSSERRCPI